MPQLAETYGDAYAEVVKRHCYSFVKDLEGKPVLGKRAVKRIPWHHLPERKRVQTKRKIRKTFGGKDIVDCPEHIGPTFTYNSREEFFRQVARRKGFRTAYAGRLEAWKAGDRTSPWPYGTFAMCRRFGAPQAFPD